MRVAYVINSLEGGGAALPLVAVVRLLQDRGDEVRVLALSRRDGRAAAALDAAGIDWRVAPAGKGQHLRAALWLLREVGRHRPALIWTSLTQATLLGQLAGLLSRTPVVSWQHNAVIKPANLRLLRLTRRLTGLWVADSEAVARLTRTRLRLAPARVAVWPLVIATRPTIPPAAHRPGGVLRIGSLGRLHPNKGYDVLVQALARLSSDPAPSGHAFEVVVGGEGDERRALEAAIARLGVRSLRLPGFQAQPEAFLAACHAYVQPSRAEGLCIAAHQAMAAGLPVIVSAVGEAPASVQAASAGLVVPPDDVGALADALRTLLADPGAAREMGLRGKAYVLARFGAERFRSAGAAVATRAEALVRERGV